MTPRMSREEAKARTGERLLAAADDCFVRDGFHGASLDEIAEAADVTTGAVYSRFDGKADLFLAVFERRLDERIAEVDRLGRPEAGGFDDTTATQWFERLERERAWHLAALEFRLYAARSPGLRRRFAKSQRRFLEAVSASYAYTHDVEDPAELEVIARAMIAIGNGYALERLIDPARVSEQELARIAGAVIKGLAE